MASVVSLEDSYSYAETLTRAEAKNFFYSFRFLPPLRRRSIYAIYAFSRRCDDAVDAVEEATFTEEQARGSLRFLGTLLDDHPPEDPLVPALRDTMERYSVPAELLRELIAGMEMDLIEQRYETFQDLYEYCYRAASVIGLVCIRIFGFDRTRLEAGPEGDPDQLAEKMGIAMQLTNIIRDVKEDSQRGRIYLPAEDLERFGYTASDLQQGTVDDRFRDLMRFQVGRARSFFAASDPLFALILPESRYCPVLLTRFYRKILETVERQHYDVLNRRPSLPWHQKLRLAGSLWLRSRLERRRHRSAQSPIQKEVT